MILRVLEFFYDSNFAKFVLPVTEFVQAHSLQTTGPYQELRMVQFIYEELP